MRKYLTAFVLAGAIVSVPATAAFAAKPTHPVHPATHIPAVAPSTATTTKTPTVMYVLRGSIGGFAAATSSADGSITITVKASNLEQKTLKGMTLTFATTDAKGAVVLHSGKAIASGDLVLVKIRAPKNSDATVLESKSPFQVIDLGPASK